MMHVVKIVHKEMKLKISLIGCTFILGIRGMPIAAEHLPSLGMLDLAFAK